MSSDEQPFFDRLRADPHSDGPRLIYADWLDDHGEPDRAEFIRVQCALARLPDDAPQRPALAAREAELREANEVRWAAPVADLVTDWEFRRGVLDSVSVNPGQFIRHGQAVFAAAPVRKVRFVEVGDQLPALVHVPLIGLIRELDLVGNDLGRRGPEWLDASPYLGHLEALDLGFTELTDRGLAVLSRSPTFGRLRSLHINDNPRLRPAGLRALAESPHLTDLVELDVSGNGLTDDALRPILAGPGGRLRNLVLHGNRLGDAGTALFVNALVFGRMAATGSIDLRRVEMGPTGGRAIAESPSLADIETLILDGNSVGDAGLTALAGSPHATRLKVLSLRENRISDDGTRALARSPVMATLRVLDLTGNIITQPARDRLHEASVSYDWRGLLELRADPNQLTRPAPNYARGLPP
jgi:uncharacterized protein (TIGR02996 family)